VPHVLEGYQSVVKVYLDKSQILCLEQNGNVIYLDSVQSEAAAEHLADFAANETELKIGKLVEIQSSDELPY
jgi:hypothetical protein